MDEQMREKFEAWFSDGGKWPQAIERSRDGYKLITAQNGWEAWQACTAALSQPAAADKEMLEALQVTAGNIRSLGLAGAIPEPYKIWLSVVEDAIVKAAP